MANEFDLVLERTLDAPIDLVWKAYTDPEHLKRWFSPKPYEITEIEVDLRPGGIFRFRMIGPDGFDTGHGTPGCVLEVIDREKFGLDQRARPRIPTQRDGRGLRFLPDDRGDHLRRRRQRPDSLQGGRSPQGRCRPRHHEKMGFHDGWGTTASQLEELAQSLAANA